MKVPHTRLEDAEVVDNSGELEVGGVGDVGHGSDGEAVGSESTGLLHHMGSGEVGI